MYSGVVDGYEYVYVFTFFLFLPPFTCVWAGGWIAPTSSCKSSSAWRIGPLVRWYFPRGPVPLVHSYLSFINIISVQNDTFGSEC